MKTRIISAIIMLILFIPILVVGDVYYTVVGSILGLMALWEILRLHKRIPFGIKIFSYLVCLFLMVYRCSSTSYLESFNFPIIGSLFLMYSLLVIIRNDLSKYNYKDSIWVMVMTLMIGFIKIRFLGLNEVIYCFIISITTDTFAYFGGSLFGKHHFTKISPNKTIEGCISGSLFGTIIGSIFYYFVIGSTNLGIMILLSFLLTIVSQVGDLFFSSIKREHQVKDFSQLIPGHGGILDRLDSVLFVIMGFLLYSMI